MKQALLVTSFGTSVATARNSITAVEQALQQAAPEFDFFRAFTSPTIRRKLTAAGEEIFSLEEMLTRLCEQGYQRVIVATTLLLYGFEYEKLQATIAVREPILTVDTHQSAGERYGRFKDAGKQCAVALPAR